MMRNASSYFPHDLPVFAKCARVTCLTLAIFFLVSNDRQDKALAQESESSTPIVQPLEDWACVFADQKSILRYSCVNPSPSIEMVDWKLSVGQRILLRGQVQAKLKSIDDGGGAVEIAVEPNNLKPAAAIATTLTLTFHTDDGKTQVIERPFIIFPSDPFANLLPEIRSLNLQLFDPLGATAKVFNASGIPFTLRRTLASIDDVKDGTLLIGEGLNWKEQKAVPMAVERALQRGLTVLCLAPTGGEITLASKSTDAIFPPEMYLAGEDVVRKFDRHLDTRTWLGGASAISKFSLEFKDRQLWAVVSELPLSWPCVEMHGMVGKSDRPNGTLILCGFGIVKHWQAGPVPRYLLSGIFQKLSKAEYSQAQEE